MRSGKCAFIFVFGNSVLDLHKTEIKCTCTKDKRQPLAHVRDAHAHNSCCPGPECAPNTAFEIVPVIDADKEDKASLKKMLTGRPRPAHTHKANASERRTRACVQTRLRALLLLHQRAAPPLAMLQPFQLQFAFPRCEGRSGGITNTLKQQPETAVELPQTRTARRLADWRPSAGAQHHLPPPCTRRQHQRLLLRIAPASFGSHQGSARSCTLSSFLLSS